MSRHVRSEDGLYHISGNTFKNLVGSRAQVHNQSAYETSGGLTKSGLIMNKWGRIVSARKHKTAKKEKRLQKHGFFATKGKFGVTRKNMNGGKKSRKSQKE